MKKNINKVYIFYLKEYWPVFLSISILCLLSLLFLFLTNLEFTFDESAVWFVATNKDVISLILGQYTHVGDLPISYLIYKIIFLVSGYNEIYPRIVPLFFYSGSIGLISILLKKIFDKNRSGWIFYTISLSILPATVYFALELKSYSVGLFFQILLLFIYQKITSEKRISWLLSLFFVSFICLFTSFSSVYLFIFLIITSIYKYIVCKEIIYKKILYILIFNLFIFFTWFFNYLISPFSFIALNNYVGYRDRDLIIGIKSLFINIFYFSLTWSGVVNESLKIHFYQKIASYISIILVSISIFFSFIKLIYSREKIMSYLFLSLLTLSIIISILFIHVLGLRLNLLFALLVPYFLFNSTNKIKIQIFTFILITILSLIFFIYVGSSYSKYSYKELVKFMYEQKRDDGCIELIASHEIGYDALYFYMKKENKELDNYYLTRINYNIEAGMTNIDYNLESIEKRKCNQIFFLHTYDLFETNFPEKYLKLMEYMHKNNVNYTSHYSFDSRLGMTIFKKNN